MGDHAWEYIVPDRPEGQRTDGARHDIALFGLRQAIERMGIAAVGMFKGEGQRAHLASLGEALWWIASLDDHCKHIEGESAYFTRRDADGAGQTVSGLIYARNLHGHNLAPLATIATHSEAAPLRLPYRENGPHAQVIQSSTAVMTLVWRELSHLQAPTKAERHGRDQLYSDHVAGRPLRDPVADGLAFFTDA